MGSTGPHLEAPDVSGPRYSESLARGLAIIESFTPECPVLGIADLAKAVNMSRSTTHRYVTTLLELGYLKQNKRRKYRLSLHVTTLGMSALNATGLREQGHAVLEGLRRDAKLIASLAVLDGLEIVCIDQVASVQRGRSDTRLGIGSRSPAYCTAMGKVLLAHLPKIELRDRLSSVSLERRGPNAITGKGALQTELTMILEEGFATEDEELAKGRTAIAAPVHDASGELAAAIELSANTPITVEQLVDRLRSHLIVAADRISAYLGYRHEMNWPSINDIPEHDHE